MLARRQRTPIVSRLPEAAEYFPARQRDPRPEPSFMASGGRLTTSPPHPPRLGRPNRNQTFTPKLEFEKPKGNTSRTDRFSSDLSSFVIP
jgi:hypothetical protein